jgi:hypothetical protein
MSVLSFKPTPYNLSSYKCEPCDWMTQVSLQVILCYGSLPIVARAALARQGFGETNRGLGLEYPTRADKIGFVRWWRWDWHQRQNETGGYRLKTRKFHLPERIYLGVLVGVLRAHDLVEEADAIAAQMAYDDILVEFIPSIYDSSNYQIDPADRDVRVCLVDILQMGDLKRSRDLVVNYERLNVSESVYLDVLDRLIHLHQTIDRLERNL